MRRMSWGRPALTRARRNAEPGRRGRAVTVGAVFAASTVSSRFAGLSPNSLGALYMIVGSVGYVTNDVRKFFMWYQMMVAAGLFEVDKKKKKAEAENEAKEDKKAKPAGAKGAPKKKASAAKRSSAPKAGGASKAKAKPMHKGAQRGS